MCSSFRYGGPRDRPMKPFVANEAIGRQPSYMTTRNEVVLLPIPFTDLKSRRVRPAIVIGRRGADHRFDKPLRREDAVNIAWRPRAAIRSLSAVDFRG